MKKIVIASAVVSSFLFALTEDQNIIQSSSYGKSVVIEKQAQNVSGYEKQEHFRREAIYNFILFQQSQNDKQYLPVQAKLINLVDENITKNKESDDKNKNEKVNVVGYCLFPDNVTVGIQPSASKIFCNTNIGQLEVFGNLTPINKNYSLIFDPIYIDFKGWRYKVVESRVLNEAKTSYNIATYVNDRKLREIVLQATADSADILKVQSSDYLKQLEASKKSKKIEYTTVGNNNNSYIAPVQNEQTKKPDAIDYLAKAGIDITSSIIKNASEVFKKDLPFLYEISGGSRVYLDIKIDRNGEKIK